MKEFGTLTYPYRELFGPIIPLVPVDSVDDAIAFINARSVTVTFVI